MIKRKIIFAIIAVVAIFIFVACSNDNDAEITYDDRSVEINATNFLETFEEVFTLTPNDIVRVEGEISRGNVEVIVTNISTGIITFSANNPQGSRMSFIVQEAGEHTITIIGNSFNGTLRLHW
ncbi:MAG: hypothetical protein FWE33_05305 [Defluviitaleaceae bacterium]|nr:hypothetical protein [Defluviitaleaceae bacterium]